MAEAMTGAAFFRMNLAGAMDLSRDGRRLVVTSGGFPGHPPRIIDLHRGVALAELNGHDGPVCSVAFSPDGRYVATAAADRNWLRRPPSRWEVPRAIPTWRSKTTVVFKKILIANRGEIAVRIIRTAREMSIATVAVYSEADRDGVHVRMADEAYLIGPAAPSASYLNIDTILEVAKRSGAQAIHPGYGFLAENSAFARRVVAAGLVWIGPHADAIDAMGDKLRARQAMAKADVPFVPGGTQAIDDVAAAREAALAYGLPLALKASGGGGGKGLKVARTLDDIESAFTTAKREAEAYFKNGTIYAERYLDNPKHVELQILADKHGNVVHVGERDCSLQRRHQKLWEEAPANIPLKVRARDA